MDPGAVVTAYPIPPDYFQALEADEIAAMRPPPTPTDSQSAFGIPILVRRKGPD